jgi:hypothetical protein
MVKKKKTCGSDAALDAAQSGSDAAAAEAALRLNGKSFGQEGGNDPAEAARKRWEKEQEKKAASGEEVPDEPAAEPEFPDPGPLPVEEGMPDQLAAMIHVCRRPASADATGLERTCRAWLKENVGAFMAAKTKLESDFLAYKTAKKSVAGGEKSISPGAQAVQDQILRVFPEFEEFCKRAGI